MSFEEEYAAMSDEQRARIHKQLEEIRQMLIEMNTSLADSLQSLRSTTGTAPSSPTPSFTAAATPSTDGAVDAGAICVAAAPSLGESPTDGNDGFEVNKPPASSSASSMTPPTSVADLVVPVINTSDCECEDTVPVVPILTADEDHEHEVNADAAVSSSKPVTPSVICTLNQGVTHHQVILTDLIPAPANGVFLSSFNTIVHDAHQVFEVMPCSFYVFSVDDAKYTGQLQHRMYGDVDILSSGHKPFKPPWPLDSAFSVVNGKCNENLLPNTSWSLVSCTTYHEQMQWKPPWAYPVCIDITICYLTSSLLWSLWSAKLIGDV